MCILCAIICHFTGAFKGKFFNVGLLHKVAISLVENKILIKSKALQPKKVSSGLVCILHYEAVVKSKSDKNRHYKSTKHWFHCAGVQIWAEIWWFLTKNISGTLPLFTSTKKRKKIKWKLNVFLFVKKRITTEAKYGIYDALFSYLL